MPPIWARTRHAPPVGGLAGPAGGGGENGTTAPASSGTTTLTRAKGAPWHFKLMVFGVTVYMIYRIYWLIEWLPKHI